MSKLNQSKQSHNGQFLEKYSAEKDLAVFRRVVSDLIKNPTELRALLVKAGITTRAGNLTKGYRSK